MQQKTIAQKLWEEGKKKKKKGHKFYVSFRLCLIVIKMQYSLTIKEIPSRTHAVKFHLVYTTFIVRCIL